MNELTTPVGAAFLAEKAREEAEETRRARAMVNFMIKLDGVSILYRMKIVRYENTDVKGGPHSLLIIQQHVVWSPRCIESTRTCAFTGARRRFDSSGSQSSHRDD
jgi:hypothetical protein